MTKPRFYSNNRLASGGSVILGGFHVRLADYVVSYSLQINNRCLRYLAEFDARGDMGLENNDILTTPKATSEPATVYTESLLARDSRRLVSLWALMQPCRENATLELQRHTSALHSCALALADVSSSRRIAVRLATLAGSEIEAEAIFKVARHLPVEVTVNRDALGEIFAQDSYYWRESTAFEVLDDDVIQQRIARSYRKSHRLAQNIQTELPADWLDQSGHKLHRWVQRSVHQLELLRPGLSDKARAQLWYLDKMSDTLRTRAGLRELRRAARKAKVKKTAAKMAISQIEQQLQKMDKRIVRLAAGCFASKPKRLDGLTQQAVAILGIQVEGLTKNSPKVIMHGDTQELAENAYG